MFAQLSLEILIISSMYYIPKYYVPSIESTALNNIWSVLFGLEWVGKITLQWQWLLPQKPSGRSNAGWRKESHGLTDMGLDLGLSWGRLTVASSRGCQRRAEDQVQPPATCPAEAGGGREGWPLTHLVGDLKWKQKTQFRERSFLLRSPLPRLLPGQVLPWP